MAADTPVRLRVTVAGSPAPRQVEQVELDLDPGSRVADAVRASGLAERHPSLVDAALACWGRRVSSEAPLADGDRIELLRPLVVDPKESRRLRYRAQGERGRRSKTGSGR